MPLYEYKCDHCGDTFEVIQKFSDEPVAVHQACGGPVRRLLSSPALQFKGSGWYVTDYAKPGGAGSKSNGSSESKPESKSESKTGSSSSDSKPAASSTTASSDKK